MLAGDQHPETRITQASAYPPRTRAAADRNLLSSTISRLRLTHESPAIDADARQFIATCPHKRLAKLSGLSPHSASSTTGLSGGNRGGCAQPVNWEPDASRQGFE